MVSVATNKGKILLFSKKLYNPLTALGPAGSGGDLIAWWAADSRTWGSKGGMTIATGASSWRDNVASYDQVQATGSAQPAFSASSYGGSPGVGGDGIDDYMACADTALLALLPSGATAGELWWLIEQDALPADATARYFGGFGNNSLAGSRLTRRNVTTGVNRGTAVIGDGAVAQTLAGTNVNLSTRHVIREQIGGASTLLTIDGVSEGTLSVTPNTTPLRHRLFTTTSTSPSGFGQCIISQHLVTKALSADKAAALQTYLMNNRRI